MGFAHKTRLLTLASAISFSACVIDTVPLPENGPDDKAEFDPSTGRQGVIKESALYYTDSYPAILVGAEWAVPARVKVTAANPERQSWRGETQSAANGSFNMPVDAGTGDFLAVAVVVDGESLASVILTLQPPSVQANMANATIGAVLEDADGFNGPPGRAAEAVVVFPPDAQGMVSVSAPAGTVLQGISVVIANVTAGTATVTDTREDGSFLGRLPGDSSDQLSIFAVEPASSNSGDAPIIAFVP